MIIHNSKLHEYRIFSQKCLKMIITYSTWARDYAKWLEHEPCVDTYEANIPLNMQRFKYIPAIGIRSEYFDYTWMTDFKITTTDGRVLIRELATKSQLQRRMFVERLEFSRRYWKTLDISEWKIVILED